MAFSASPITETGQSSAPKHVAIIMDGNGRWAQKRKLPRALGHKRGAEAVREAIEGAVEAGVEFLTIYAFSSENWNRSAEEVSDLMGLLKLYLSKEVKSLHKENIRLNVIGNRGRLSEDIKERILQAEELTANNTRLTFTIALSYGSREEIVEASKGLAVMVQNGTIKPEEINENTLNSLMFTSDLPDPDLMIRTSGEMRLSNFLLWQSAYTEFLFLDTLWPDFTKQHFSEAVETFLSRDRRYGGRP
ncbi:isoprenyl transferase [Kordiimonas sp. SCSIO 12603]|uniref:isoprenyl transferase n=1 Tax=Kordiimonas sp. SCSIO 12603 TaxID=2829596 RepID=UPI002103C4AD|nr:isoprenyl transferase [Kordiimonas sp. SCSIO 12603]UTW57481.1 isoprenyl transferase [Kordiimonas sp. SCSIO 12603]